MLYKTSRAEMHLKLIEAGADVNVVNARGEQVLHLMLSSPWMSSRFILDFLRQPQGREQAFSETASGYSALHYALYMLRPDICTELLLMGVSPQIKFQDESGPLSYIALQCLDKRIWQQKLSGHNHDPPWDSWGAKREAGHTEACLSLWEGFVAAGHDVDARDRLGCPPLFNFLRWIDPHAYHGSLRPLEAHLAAKPDGGRDGKRGSVSRGVGEAEPLNLVWFDTFFGTADLRATDNTGTTALHVVASLPGQFGAAKTFQCLVIKGGLDPLTEDHLGRSSLDVAAETGKEEVLELFRQRKG
ncbi:hypothetical protein F5X68DRAFT_209578 [Plectosphaerella plurivora]|uniref:Ankyrin repeat protein n=1 Tax=Plectosphaerella plurivora TaxID=936078 RepID=A0A9P8V9P0_9PEZI|nr:hypothetical protein F5X68DRAFT_209578 [Plectosphaerella plurivora]